jgi:hypothetical protein
VPKDVKDSDAASAKPKSFDTDKDQKLPASQDGVAVLVKDVPTQELPTNLLEYGYGFWLRYLTTYPTRQWSGKNAPFYFVSRLTSNNPNGDKDFGDRILAIW